VVARLKEKRFTLNEIFCNVAHFRFPHAVLSGATF
jgi:hypothetical protein